MKPSARPSLVTGLLLACLAAPTPGDAQLLPAVPDTVIPRTDVDLDRPDATLSARDPLVEADGAGGFVTVWNSHYTFELPDERTYFDFSIVAARLGAELGLGVQRVVTGVTLATADPFPPTGPALATHQGAFDVVSIFERQLGSGLELASYAATTERTGVTTIEAPVPLQQYPSVGQPAIARDGDLIAVAWTQMSFTFDLGPDEQTLGTYFQLFAPDGTPVSPLVTLSEVTATSSDSFFEGTDPAVGWTPQSRYWYVVWQPVAAETFDPEPPRVALMTRNGDLLAINEVEGPLLPPYDVSPLTLNEFLWAGRSADGAAVLTPRSYAGDRFRFTEPWAVVPGADRVALSSDRHNNVVATFEGAGRPLEIRAYNRHGDPQGAPVAFPDATDGDAGLADSGTVLVVRDAAGEDHLVGATYRTRRDADLCFVDRRGDLYCLFEDGSAEVSGIFPLGFGSDRRVAGDADGDSLAEVCVVRGNRFLCDTRQQGGGADLRFRFGPQEAMPLFGDLDGDGRDDPCLRIGNRFLCDTARNGGAAEMRIPFGRAQDRALLGDADGDGRDDPCLYRAGLFACDTAHDGVFAEVFFDLTGPLAGRGVVVSENATPLMGDLDGDGRDEVCVAGGGLAVCGFFPPTGGTPSSSFQVGLGDLESVYLMGDFDGF
jgi:hypothetical protein